MLQQARFGHNGVVIVMVIRLLQLMTLSLVSEKEMET